MNNSPKKTLMNKAFPRHPGDMMMAVLLLFMVCMPSHMVAQDSKVVRDLRLWTGVKIEKSFAKDWTLSLEEEVRFKQDISELSNYFTEAGLRYRINKNFSLGAGYRYTRDKKKDGSFETLTRYNLDLRYRGRIDFLTIDYRLRYQKEVEGFNIFDQQADYEKYVRNRIRIRYNDFKAIEPFVSAELFQLFRPNYFPEFHYIRVIGGLRYEAGKLGDIDLAFGFNREFANIEPFMIYVIKANYTYKF